MTRKRVIYNGKEFNSQAALARYLNVTPSVLGIRIKEGYPQSRWGERTKYKEIEYQGKIFPSHKELASHLNISRDVLESRIKRKVPQSKWHLKSLREITFQEEVFDSIKVMTSPPLLEDKVASSGIQELQVFPEFVVYA